MEENKLLCNGGKPRHRLAISRNTEAVLFVAWVNNRHCPGYLWNIQGR
jgi:hypothetical protein